MFAPQDEGDEADGTRDVIVRQLHQFTGTYAPGTEACKYDLKHPQAQEPCDTWLYPFVRLNTRQQDVIDFVHVPEQTSEKVLRLNRLDEESNLLQALRNTPHTHRKHREHRMRQ